MAVAYTGDTIGANMSISSRDHSGAMCGDTGNDFKAFWAPEEHQNSVETLSPGRQKEAPRLSLILVPNVHAV